MNPKTGATYNVVTVDGETQTVKTYKGTFAETGRTSLTGFPIYVFVSEEERSTRMSRQSALRHWRVPRPVRIICSFMTRNMKGASLLQIPRTGF
ncbi:MAG: ubiquitin-like domain-containing protein [Oscillospiraceae bacterium]|nr:MAG: ubiquitin-like domain-containing protein [Oscillospiraceae bacterium]